MLNSAALSLIKEFEGFVDHWYPDPAHGWDVPTCLYGHTNATGNDPMYRGPEDRSLLFTEALGSQVLARDLRPVEVAVDDAVKVRLNDNERGALVSFTYNLGAGNLRKSTLLKKLNLGDRAGAAAEFAKWNKAGGKILPGLTRRRNAEAALFLKPVETAMPIQPDPVTINATNQEPWYKSRIIIGLIGAGVGFIAMRFGVTISQDDIKFALDNIGAIVTAAGVLFALYGRIVGGKKPPMGGA